MKVAFLLLKLCFSSCVIKNLFRVKKNNLFSTTAACSAIFSVLIKFVSYLALKALAFHIIFFLDSILFSWSYKTMRHLILIILVLFCVLTFSTSCSTTTATNTQSETREDVEEPQVFYDSKYYEEIYTVKDLPEDCFLQKGQEPQIFYSDDIASEVNELLSNYYIILGLYGYNGPANPLIEEVIRSLCIDKKAAIGVYTFEEADTRTGAYNSYSIKRYDYYGYLFVPMNLDLIAYFYRVGISAYDLEASDKITTKRNTGAVVDTIYYNSPAYFSSLFKGDVITEVNGISITNAGQLKTLLDSYDSTQEIEITYYRDGVSYKTSLTPLY